MGKVTQNLPYKRACLLYTSFMLISYIWAKIPYGMTAVFCCLALEITGVLSSAEAWAGFGNTTVFLFASIFILGAGLMKTSFIIKIQKLLQDVYKRQRFCLSVQIWHGDAPPVWHQFNKYSLPSSFMP